MGEHRSDGRADGRTAGAMVQRGASSNRTAAGQRNDLSNGNSAQLENLSRQGIRKATRRIDPVEREAHAFVLRVSSIGTRRLYNRERLHGSEESEEAQVHLRGSPLGAEATWLG